MNFDAVSPLANETVFELLPDVRYRNVLGEGVILRQAEGEVLISNKVGAKVMDQLNGKSRVADILDGVIRQFEVERDTAEQDLTEFLGELMKAGVIRERRAAGT